MTTLDKPRKGKPQTEAQKAAVIAMESDVVHRHAVRGHTFYRIERDLGITHAKRIYERAMSARPLVQREDAHRIQQERLNALHEKAWEALSEDGLESLWERLRSLLSDMEAQGSQIDAGTIMDTVQRAYADTYKAVPVALAVHDRVVKLDGLDHGARIADASLALDQARVQLMAVALVGVLQDLGLSAEDQSRGVVLWGAKMEAAQGDSS